MTIGIFYGGYYPGSGGIQTHIKELVKTLPYQFEIITDAFPEFPKDEENVIRVGPKNSPISKKISSFRSKASFLLRLKNDIKRIKKKRKLLQKKDYDVVHFHSAGIGGALYKYCLIRKDMSLMKKYSDFSFLPNKILTVHGLSHLLVDNPLIKEFEMHFIRQFDEIICIDKRLHEYLREELMGDKLTSRKIHFIPNSINCRDFSYNQPKIKKKLIIGFIGRLEKSRGIHLLIELILNRPKDCEIMVLGAGNHLDFSRFESQVDLDDIILFKNFSYDMMPKFYKQFDILFNPVMAEGISRVTLEAMASGNPVIMLDIGNRYPVIDRTTGFLIKDDINRLLELIKEIRKDKKWLKMVSKKAREKVLAEFDNSIIIPKYERIYDKWLKTR